MQLEHMPQQIRTPEQHREEVDGWRANAPTDDWELFQRKNESPRHGAMADQLAPLLMWMSRPEGVLPDDPVMASEDRIDIASSWQVQPSNDNVPPHDFRVERNREIAPSIEEIMRHVEFGDIERNRHGQIVRIGDLRFSGGNSDPYDTPSELGYKLGPDGKVAKAMIRVPAGGLMGQKERLGRAVGGEASPADISASNRYFEDIFKAKHRYRSGAKDKSKGRFFSREENIAMLAEAYANTPVLPPIKRYPPGLPSGASAVADSFIGMRKTSCAGGGAEMWQDICSSIIHREVWLHAIAEMTDQDIQTLEKVTSGKAHSLEEFGRAMGHSSKYAAVAGRRAVVAANDNLAQNIKNIAA